MGISSGPGALFLFVLLMISSSSSNVISAVEFVQWVFGDSEEHNVTSKASIFSDSDDLLGGTHEHLFDDPGTFGYSCSLHASMRGYSIVVVDPNESSD